MADTMITMRRWVLLLSASLIVGAGVFSAACKQKTTAAAGDEGDGGTAGDNTSGDDDTNSGDTTPSTQGTPAQPSNGIPCDVEAVVENRCAVSGCHGGEAPAAATFKTWDDFQAPSTADPSKNRGQLAAQYMLAKTMPKPPAVATDAEIKTFSDWVAAGMAKSAEACVITDSDAGAVPPVDAGTTTTTADGGQCTSGTHYTTGTGAFMHPGGDCIGCHSAQQGPAFTFAGTVYPALHDVDDCNGVDGTKSRITVVATDRKGRSVTMQVNAQGNFYLDTTAAQATGIAPPYRITVIDGAKTRRMSDTITGGDCNSCHKSIGVNGAPGRIVDPADALQ